MGTDVTTQEGGLPALRSTPALAGFDASDFALPRLYKGEGQSAFVQDGLVEKGKLFIAAGKDDPEPVVIGDSVTVYVLDAFKRLSLQDENGELQTWAVGDPEAPPEARTDYHYVLALPDVDPDVPVKLTLAKTSAGCGKRINFAIVTKGLAVGKPLYSQPFELTVEERKSQKGGQRYQWYVWKEKRVEATPEGLAVAESLAEMVESQPAPSTTSEPGI